MLSLYIFCVLVGHVVADGWLITLNEAKVKMAATVSMSTTTNYSSKIAITVKVSSLLRAWR